jgi:hypothetical protein
MAVFVRGFNPNGSLNRKIILPSDLDQMDWIHLAASIQGAYQEYREWVLYFVDAMGLV